VQWLSRKLEKGIIAASADEIYGRDLNVANPAQGPLGLFGKSLITLDEIFSESDPDLEKLYDALPQSPVPYFSVILNWKATDSISDEKKIFIADSTRDIAMEWQKEQLGLGRDLQNLDQISRVVVVDRSRMDEFISLDESVYRWLAENNQERWIPSDSILIFGFPGWGYRFVLRLSLSRPCSFNKLTRRLDRMPLRGFATNRVFILTLPWNDGRSMSRFYPRRGNPAGSPKLKLDFGYLSSELMISWPRSRAAESVKNVPTILLSIREDADFGTVSLKNNPLLNVAKIYLPIQSVMIDLGDQRGPRVIQKESRIPSFCG